MTCRKTPFRQIQSARFHGGFTIVEIVAAIALLTACIVGFAQMFALDVAQRNAERTWQTAADQVQNVFEQIADLPTDKLIALDFDKSEYEQTTRRAVPKGEINFSCTPAEFDGEVKSYVLRAAVSWDRGSRPRGEVSLFRLLTVPPAPKGETEQ
jgi:hypothetical protein